jgi:hypothetical protein
MFNINRTYIDANGYTLFAGKYNLMKASRYMAHLYYRPKHIKGRVVHHIDLNRQNDNIDNLLIVSKSEHIELHKLYKKNKSEYNKKVSEYRIRQQKYMRKEMI